MSAIGQRPVVLRNECDGFILNRLQYALLAEAIRLVQSGVASPEDVDVAVTHGCVAPPSSSLTHASDSLSPVAAWPGAGRSSARSRRST